MVSIRRHAFTVQCIIQHVLVIILFVSSATNGEDAVFPRGNKKHDHDNHDETTTTATTPKKQHPTPLVGQASHHQLSSSSSRSSAPAVMMIVHDDQQESEIRRQLLEKAPPNRYQINLPPYYVRKQTPTDFYKSKFRDKVHFDLTPKIHPDFDRIDLEIKGWWKRFKNKELSYDETLIHTEPLRNSYQEMLSVFNNEIDQWNDKVDEELQRRWDIELSEDEKEMYSKELQSQQNAWQDYEETKERFQKELQTIIANSIKKHQIVNPMQSKKIRRYPDHEFAIEQSYMLFHWSLANSFLMILESSNNDVPNALIVESNIPGKIPVFVDSSWQHGLDDLLSCPKKRKTFEEIPEEEQEFKWVETSYYKVYPPDDVYIEDDADGFTEAYASWGHSLQFNRTSVRRFLQLTWTDIQHGQQWTRVEFSEPIFTSESDTGQLHAKVVAFRSKQGDRIELWEEKEEDDAYAILQTHRGRVVVISVFGGHAYLLCNLLEFYNSDGSMDMPHFLPYLNDPKRFARNILKTAESFLYKQMH